MPVSIRPAAFNKQALSNSKYPRDILICKKMTRVVIAYCITDLYFWFLNGSFLLIMQDKTFRHPYISAIGSHTYVYIYLPDSLSLSLSDYWREFCCLKIMYIHQWLLICACLVRRNYWRDCDTVLFILKHLYRDIPEDPNSPEECNESDSKNISSGSTGWINQREAIEEELPLTFSDRSVARNFSSKARKYLKKSWILWLVVSLSRCLLI